MDTIKPPTHLPRILLVDDDTELSEFTKANLESEGYTVTIKNNAESGIYAFKSGEYDLVLLDIVMPGINGMEAAKAIRVIDEDVPIIFLTSQSNLQIRIEGFKSGADDYIVKPFSFVELHLRIKSILKRSGVAIKSSTDQDIRESITVGNCLFHFDTRELQIGAENKKLSKKEMALFRMLHQHVGEYIKREDVLIQIWGRKDEFAVNSMDVYISRLRKLLRDDPALEIENLHGTGFRLVVH